MKIRDYRFLWATIKGNKRKRKFKSHYPKGYGLISSYQDKTDFPYFFWVSVYTYSVNLRYLERK